MLPQKSLIVATLNSNSNIEKNLQEAKKRGAGAVELRLDLFEEIPLKEIKNLNFSLPVIATNRPRWEGGKFEKSEKQRIEILKKISKYVDAVDIELRSEEIESTLKYMQNKDVDIIVSYHDFEKTPSKNRMKSVIQESLKLGDISKIAVKAQHQDDILDILELVSKSEDFCGIAMGELGSCSRFLAPILGSPLTYATLEDKVAPGQLTIEQTKRGIKIFT